MIQIPVYTIIFKVIYYIYKLSYYKVIFNVFEVKLLNWIFGIECYKLYKAV